jgi:hypothetical protein
MGEGWCILLNRLPVSTSHLIVLACPLKAGRKSSATVPLSISIYGRGVVYPPGQITGSFVKSWLKIPPFSARLPYHKNKKEISYHRPFKCMRLWERGGVSSWTDYRVICQ